ncbi:hypothetical protein WR25_18761 [Diploscapter pachys]|uniref:Uncharacterized protein n=1 Tax=Diploscapter pachys TaxID=2018661 RepID=A0A2A2KSS3_9BILA|nr:hypothetical protein WR25_18761 [Diploscapter pachys]
MLVVLLIIANYAFILHADKACPGNSLMFDYQECDPDKRSTCPSGFTCRKATDTSAPNSTLHLCCESSVMSMADWLAEAQLSPQVFPQAPMAILSSVELTPLDSSTQFPSIHIGDEVVVLTYPNYAAGVIQAVTFANPPQQGGFAHVLVVVDPAYKPFGVFLYSNLPTTGQARLLTSSQQNGSPNFISYIDNSTAVDTSDSYRAQYVVLVYATGNPVNFPSSDALISGCDTAVCLLKNNSNVQQLGQPLAGSIFYLTTKKSIYRTAQPQASYSSSLCKFIFVSLITFLFNLMMQV